MKFKKGQVPWNKNLECSEETKLKISLANQGRIPPNKGISCPEETKKKISIANKGKIPPNKGIPMTDEQRKKCSEAHMGQTAWNKGTKGISGAPKPQSFKDHRREQWLGANNPNWKEGATLKKERIKGTSKWRTWRKTIFERDNYTCQECGVRGATLHPHHIKEFASYPELRFEIDNGITLCEKCHRKSANYGSRPLKKVNP